jgi:methionine synthase II (cobalamin-independent)
MAVPQTSRALDLLRVDHTGGFRKPDYLRDAYVRFARGEVSQAEVERLQDEAVRTIVAQQEAHNLPILSDGEYRRRQFQESFGEAVRGFKAQPGWTYVGGSGEYAPTRRVESGPSGSGPAVLHRLPVNSRLELVRNVPLEEYRFAAPLTGRPVKVTLVGPDRVAQRFEWETSMDVYPGGLDEFVSDVVRIQRLMVSQLVMAGCPYIQLDEPGYTAYVDEPLMTQMRARGEDPAANLARSIAADNAVVADFADTTFGVHICRGGGSSGYHRDGRYDAIAERLFGELRCQRLLLEYDTEQSGGFDVLRFVPRGTVVVLGLISTRVPDVESVDELMSRIEQASRYISIEQLAIGPRCGLGLPEHAIWRKVDVMLETASRVWGT